MKGFEINSIDMHRAQVKEFGVESSHYTSTGKIIDQVTLDGNTVGLTVMCDGEQVMNPMALLGWSKTLLNVVNKKYNRYNVDDVYKAYDSKIRRLAHTLYVGSNSGYVNVGTPRFTLFADAVEFSLKRFLKPEQFEQLCRCRQVYQALHK